MRRFYGLKRGAKSEGARKKVHKLIPHANCGTYAKPFVACVR